MNILKWLLKFTNTRIYVVIAEVVVGKFQILGHLSEVVVVAS